MSFLGELQRRNVIRVGIVYLAAAWLIIQVAETVLPLYGLGDGPARVVVTFLAIGFPVFLVLAWVFELTPEGLKLERDVDRSQSTTAQTGKRLDRLIMVVLVLALGYFAIDKFLLDPRRDAVQVEAAARVARSQALVESYGDRSVAVLPFVNMSADPEQEYFSDGIAEELLNLLARIPDMRVISRSSAFRFKGTALDVPAIARQLNVANVVEGSVRKAGDQIRISAQLIEARSDTHLWSETYDRELTAENVFDIQNDIAESISLALNTVLSDVDRLRLRRGQTESLPAYEAYLLGRQRAVSRTRDDLQAASAYFQKTVGLDPSYALAWVGLADANLLLSNYGYVPGDEAMAKAGPALTQALMLDDELGAAHASLGLSRSMLGDVDGAVQAYRRAIALDPNYATSYHWYADILLNSLGQPAAAIPLLEKARRLDPLSPIIIVTLGQAHQGMGRVDEAMGLFGKALEIQPESPPAFFLIGMAFLDLGDAVRAAPWIERGIELWPDNFSAMQAKIALHRYRDEAEQALAWARRLHAMAPGNNTSLVTLVAYGRHTEAVKAFTPFYPELSCAGEPTVGLTNMFQAINLSLAWEGIGGHACAEKLLEALLLAKQAMPEERFRSYGFLGAEIHARLGHIRESLDTLRAVLDGGWRQGWWSQVEKSPHTVSLREDPQYQAILAEVRAEMQAQLQRVVQMEARGEFPPGPP